MNYGISDENDKTGIEFKNLNIVDKDQVLHLDIEKQWLSVQSQKKFLDGGGQNSKSNFLMMDSSIF